MAGKTVRVTLQQVGASAFRAETGSGHEVVLDGSAEHGGTNAGMRPMEAFLVALAGCSGIDVLHIASRLRKPIDDLTVRVEGLRRDAVPATYEHIHLVFETHTDIPEKDLERAARLSADKYCSVAQMLVPEVKVTHEVRSGGQLGTR